MSGWFAAAALTVLFCSCCSAQAPVPPATVGELIVSITGPDNTGLPDVRHRREFSLKTCVTDDLKRPIPGASVEVPIRQTDLIAGATLVRTPDPTDDHGCTTLNLKANSLTGPFKVKAQASFGNMQGSNTETLTNKAPPVVTRRRAVIAGVLAAGVIAPVFLLRSGPSPSAALTGATPSRPVGAP